MRSVAPLSWMPHAACLQEDPELFFPVGSTGHAVRAQIDAAKAVCGQCRVRAQCLSYALTSHQPEGIWGGATRQDREALARNERRHSRVRDRLPSSPQPTQ
jgi:WhiB family redox-sensing transcriptional regulator